MPPDVARQQQAPAVQQFAAGYKGPQPGGAPQGDAANSDGTAIADQFLTEAANNLAKAAQAIKATAPQLLPILQKMLQAGAELQKGLQDLSQGVGSGDSGDLGPDQQSGQSSASGAVSMG